MNSYEIGRDYQELRSRIDRLEAFLGGDRAIFSERGVGVLTGHVASAGVEPHEAPLIWKAEKHAQLPPFVNGILGLPLEIKFNLHLESKTWICKDPLILYVNWPLPYPIKNQTYSEEFYRLQNQSFSITRFNDPNTGEIKCIASYAAQLKASGKGKSASFQSQLGTTFSTSNLDLSLKNAQGATFKLLSSPAYSIVCNIDQPFVQNWVFDAGLYDLVAGATWQIVGNQRIDHC
jgi:hypothetical protein